MSRIHPHPASIQEAFEQRRKMVGERLYKRKLGQRVGDASSSVTTNSNHRVQ